MVRPARIAALSSLVVAAPAAAQERVIDIDIPATTAGEAVRMLGRQGRVSVGIHDASLLRLPVAGVRGRYLPQQVLERLFAGAAVRVRRVAEASFVVERAPVGPGKPRVMRPQRAAAPPAKPPAAVQDDVIVVTATKRDVPLSAYAGGAEILDGERLSLAEGARGTDAIEARASSVTSTHLGPGRNKLFIRGIADSSFVGPTQATVGQYWGNSRITYSAPDPSLRLYDVKRIEVLEGPQGTLYGAGSLGGVLRVVPNGPDLGMMGGQAWGGVQAIQHGAPGGDGGAILNLPIVQDRLALRVLGFGGIDGGYIDDRQRRLHDVNRVTTIGGRAALRYAPGSDWTIDLTTLAQRIHGDDSQYADREGDGLSRAGSVAQPYHNAYWLGEMVVNKRWGKTVWTTSFGYADQQVFEQFEGPRLIDITRLDVQPSVDAQPTVFRQDNHIRLRSAETRLARRGIDGAGWLIGLSLLQNRASVRRDTGEAPVRTLLTGVRNVANEATLYGEYGMTPTARTTLTLGGRVTQSSLTGESQDVPEPVALRIDPEARATRHETRLLPAASLSWRPAEGVVAFVRYQQGFRPGGIAIRQNFVQRFQGDRVETTEIGARVGRRRFDLALTLSYTRWRNVQADLVDGFGYPTTANIGDGRIRSVGWSGKWRPVDGLELDAALYLNDSHITPAYSITPATSVTRVYAITPAYSGVPLAIEVGRIDETRLPNVADRSGRIGIAYSRLLRSGQRLDLNGFARYIGKSTLGIGTILGIPQGNYLDTGLELRVGNERRGISLAATNLLDSRGNRFALGSPFLVRQQNQITPLQPRSFRLGVDAHF
ncbi:TonB-dependent receptor domain-containing protein [Sphingomonas azotifigens]|uniref:TonB-dependent receptor domain-containing protein n=1 Tax=Sphingomonas azotifigens TaxID=330920 RepID=UPI0009FEC317|nr:TonB-dependent receptor [Sphingomonas azotifigens]